MKKNLLYFFALLINTAIVYGQVDLNKGLVIYYPFSGNTLDSSGHQFNATPHNTVLGKDRNDKSDNAYYFNGVNSYMEIPTSELSNPNFSYSFWAKFESIPSSGQSAFLISIGNTDGDQTIGVCDDCPGGEGWNYISYPSLSYLSGTLPEMNVWYHIVGTRENQNLKFYINGRIVGGAGTANLPNYSSTVLGVLGMRFNGNSPFNGYLDEVRIYNRAINKDEVMTLYKLNTDPIITSTHHSATNKSLQLYPNPSSGILNGSFQSDDKIKSVTILNSLGQNENIDINQIGSDFKIDLSNVNKGIYFLKIVTEQDTFTEEIVLLN